MPSSALELWITEVQDRVHYQNPSWPTGSSIWRFDLQRTRSMNRPSGAFYDWTTSGGSFSETTNSPTSIVPAGGTPQSGSFYTDEQDVQVVITAGTLYDLKQMQWALFTAVNGLTGSNSTKPAEVGNYVVEKHSSAQVTYFQLTQLFVVPTEALVNNDSVLAPIYYITASITQPASGSLLEDPAGDRTEIQSLMPPTGSSTSNFI